MYGKCLESRDYFDDQHRRISKLSISSSAFRNQGRVGMIHATQNYLCREINLYSFSAALHNQTFETYLNKETENLVRAATKYGCKWGTARKGLNIFFRDILYNSYFFKKLNLRISFGHQLEIPLDSKTMAKIRNYYDRLELYRFDLVKPLTSEIKNLNPTKSEAYQIAAKKIAELAFPEYTRVDLDMKFWGNS